MAKDEIAELERLAPNPFALTRDEKGGRRHGSTLQIC